MIVDRPWPVLAEPERMIAYRCFLQGLSSHFLPVEADDELREVLGAPDWLNRVIVIVYGAPAWNERGMTRADCRRN